MAKKALSSEKKLAEVLNLPFDEIVRVELRGKVPCGPLPIGILAFLGIYRGGSILARGLSGQSSVTMMPLFTSASQS